MKASTCMIAVALMLISASSLRAQFSAGTWVQTAPTKGFTMSVENCCNGGRRLTFHVTLGQKQQTVTVDSPFDGSDAPVLYDGKPNGETMALKRIDDLRTSTLFKKGGKVYRTSTSTESADRKTLTVQNDFIDPADGRVTGKMTETYMRQ